MSNASPVTASPLLVQIMIELRYRYAKLNFHYETAFTDSFCSRRCCHTHQTLIEAAMCAISNGAGWYVIAVEHDIPLELTQAEDLVVRECRMEYDWAEATDDGLD